MSGSRLDDARLTRSIIFETDLTGIDLRRARVDDAEIARSNMPGAKVANATFADSECSGVTRPDGTTPSEEDLFEPCTGLPGAPAA